MNYAVDRRRPVARAHLTTDRLTLPWIALEDAHSRFAIVMCWLAMAAVLLFAAGPDFARGLDPSAETLDGFAALPLIALAAPFDMILPQNLAMTVAAAALPLLQLLVALVLVRGMLRCLDFQGASANIGLVIVPLLPLAVAVFTPLRVGEQAWEALCAVAILRLAVDRRMPLGKAWLAGLASGLILLLSPIGALLAAVAAGFFALVYLREGDARCLSAFAWGTASCASVPFLLSLALPQWVSMDGHWLSWPHLFGLWSAAGIAGGLALVRRAPPVLRLAGALSVAIAICALPVAFNGLASFPPVAVSGSIVTPYGHEVARPVDGAWHDSTGMVLATLVLWLIAIVTRWGMLSRSANPRGWLAVAVLSGAMAVAALFTYDAALLAQLLAIPLFALLMRDALRVASRLGSAPLRVAGIALALFALTPTGGAMATGLAMTVAQGERPNWPEPFSHAVAGLVAFGSHG